jgi:hypothetical protein
MAERGQMNQLYNECSMCHHKGLRPGILDTRHGDYGVRSACKEEKELSLNEFGLCHECSELVQRSLAGSSNTET